MSAKKSSKKESIVGMKEGKLLTTSITEFGQKSLTIYGAEVNLERATPDLIDGLKPVHRRVVYSASQVAKTQLVKSALLVGETMGKLHPHGDSSIYGAAVTLVQSTVPLLHGEGNWGTIVDSPAAMRYTNCRLSHFGRLGFDPNYANPEVTTYVPSYDERTVEPVSVPYPLPIILFTGASGIGYGAACSLPSFTPASVAEVLKRLLKGEKMKPEDFAKAMVPEFKWGGQFVKSKENRKAWLEMFTGPKASVLFESPLEINATDRTVIIDEWPSGVDPEKIIIWARSLPETAKAYPSKGSAEVTIQMGKGYNSVQFDAWVKKIAAKTRAKASYNITVTRRNVTNTDGVIDYDVKLYSMSVPKLIMAWLRERLATELKSLDYRIKKQKDAIAFSDLLIMVANKLAIIVPIIQKSKTPKEDLCKKLKITAEQAEAILELKLRRLTRLDQDEINETRKEQLAVLKQLEKWRAKPKEKMVADIDVAVAAIEADRKWYAAKDKDELTLAA